jgi:phytoene/squalene synthetase
LLADRALMDDAYRAYAYFRWVDDCLDAESGSRSERNEFLMRQQVLLKKCYRGEPDRDACPEEQLLIALVQHDPGQHTGLQTYLQNMMAVMAFDAERRERMITQAELSRYTRLLATAVTEAMHYFVGHGCPSPHNDTRYLAVSAAHITHMLRDTADDVRAGYFNIPLEVLETNHITPQDVNSDAYRAWVRSRVQLARNYFQVGCTYLNRVANPRCRFAGFAYLARFEWLLDTIEREDFHLRPAYEERHSPEKGWQMIWFAFTSMIGLDFSPQPMTASHLEKR